ncbi:MAG: Crp/Fnr family transcriptional regulator [Eubacterium sp.]|nr:Crp/Fnr family transcriptional regulator [Eubacterium sp.]
MTKSSMKIYDKIDLFQNIERENLTTMLHCLGETVRSYKKGEIIIMDQEHVEHVGIVLKGSVHMIKEDLWGEKTLLAYMAAGDLFGETFAIQKSTRSYVTFVAASNCEVMFLSLYHVLHPCPNGCAFHLQITENLYNLIGLKNIQLMEKIEVVSKTSLRDKILAYLSLQAQKQQSRYIDIPLNRSEMAEYLHANRSAMTRELAAMQEEGLIDFDKNTFILKKE